MPKIYLYDHATGQEVEREMTEDEAAEREVQVQEWTEARNARLLNEQNKVEAKASAESKLSALGLTPEEIAALRG